MARTFQYKGRDYDFSKIVINLTEAKASIPDVLATTALNFFKDSFRRQGWRDKGLTKWAGRKNGSRPGGAILVKRGHLRNSIRKLLVSWRLTEIGTNLPYAAAHNTGVSETVTVKSHKRRKYQKSGKRKQATGSYGVRAHKRKMNLPQRQFMGESEVLNLKIDAAMAAAVDKIFEI
jgi:phage gpG-like protein